MGFEGLSGNESMLHHLQSPCRVSDLGSLTALTREAWVPAAHAHRLSEDPPWTPSPPWTRSPPVCDDYDITTYREILFAADGIDHLLQLVGGFSPSATTILRRGGPPSGRAGPEPTGGR